jgi:hypothetical protein
MKKRYLVMSCLGLVLFIVAALNVTHIPVWIMAQTDDQPAETPPTTDLKFVYTTFGILNWTYQRIAYDSETDSLAQSSLSAAGSDGGVSQMAAQSQSNKQISDSDAINLEQMINNNRFFEINGFYPPGATGAQDYLIHVLSVTLNSRTHSVLWTDQSNNLPAELLSIANTIEGLSAK